MTLDELKKHHKNESATMDYFAGQALVGVLLRPGIEQAPEVVAEESYRIAEAMMAHHRKWADNLGATDR